VSVDQSYTDEGSGEAEGGGKDNSRENQEKDELIERETVTTEEELC
jgi:hypothetical protein